MKFLIEGFTARVTIHRDDHNPRPDKTQDGFWPSKDPASPGYIGTENDLAEHTALAQRIYDTHKAGKWWYVGVAVQLFKGTTPLTQPYDFALWGIESYCTDYIGDVAKDLADEALPAARRSLHRQIALTKRHLKELTDA